jgi:hypothetical protein
MNDDSMSPLSQGDACASIAPCGQRSGRLREPLGELSLTTNGQQRGHVGDDAVADYAAQHGGDRRSFAT